MRVIRRQPPPMMHCDCCLSGPLPALCGGKELPHPCCTLDEVNSVCSAIDDVSLTADVAELCTRWVECFFFPPSVLLFSSREAFTLGGTHFCFTGCLSEFFASCCRSIGLLKLNGPMTETERSSRPGAKERGRRGPSGFAVEREASLQPDLTVWTGGEYRLR